MTTRPLGRLLLVPNMLGPGTEPWLPAGLGPVVQDIQYWRMEDERSGRRLLAGLWRQQGLHGKVLSDRQDALDVELLNEHTLPQDVARLLEPLRHGHDVAIVSEAGMPAIADPGADAVAVAHAWGAPVVPLPGPSSLFLALAGSGLGGQRFTFLGYLPRQAPELETAIRQSEADSAQSGATQLCIETPYRNRALLDMLLQTLRPETLLCIAAELTMPSALLQMQSVGAWRKGNLPDLAKCPTVFVWKATTKPALAPKYQKRVGPGRG